MKLMRLLEDKSSDKCPHCGSTDTGLMPPDFETHKCNSCKKNWTPTPVHEATSQPGLDAIKKAIDGFDFAYQYSDDFRWWASGNASFHNLRDMIRKHLKSNPQDKATILAYITQVQNKKFTEPPMKPKTLVELLESELESPTVIRKKAELAKSRADMKQLGDKQQDLSQSRKNVPDVPSKRRLSKQIADLGVKKADLGIKVADQTIDLKKPSDIKEASPIPGYDPVTHDYDDLMRRGRTVYWTNVTDDGGLRKGTRPGTYIWHGYAVIILPFERKDAYKKLDRFYGRSR